MLSAARKRSITEIVDHGPSPTHLLKEEAVDLEGRQENKKQKTFLLRWLDAPLFQDWLLPYPGNKTRARCAACDRVLVAGFSELTKHAQTRKHERAMSNFLPRQNPMGKELSIQAADSNGTSDEQGTKQELKQEQEQEMGTKQEHEEEEESEEEEEIGDSGDDSGDESDDESDDLEDEDTDESDEQIVAITDKAVVGKHAPHWWGNAVLNGHEIELKLSDYKGHYLLIFFYPGNFLHDSAQEIIALSNRASDFRALNTEIVACSVDSCANHKAWSRINRNKGGVSGISIPLLSDSNHLISKTYGCFSEETGQAMRAHYVVDPKGFLKISSIYDLNFVRLPGELLNILSQVVQIGT